MGEKKENLSRPVAFRLSRAHEELLRKEAESRRLSVHQCARHLVIEGLSGAYRVRVADDLARLLRCLKQLQENLEAATLVTLTRVGREAVEEAEEWITENMPAV